MTARTGPDGRGGPAPGDVARAAELLAENIGLLTGHVPLADRALPGRSHVHRVALCWSDGSGTAQVCLQALSAGPARAAEPGWSQAEARGIAESLDLRLREEAEEFGSFRQWRRAAAPAYHLLLVDDAAEPVAGPALDHRCAALQATYLDGAGWLRFHAGRQFAEGSFTRLIQRVAHDVRSRLGARTEHRPPAAPSGGLC